jgi:hypothetical protein
MAELAADLKKLSLQNNQALHVRQEALHVRQEALHVRQALRAQFARNPQLVNEYVVRAARQTRAALFPQFGKQYESLCVDSMVGATHIMLSNWMRWSPANLEALRNNIYEVVEDVLKHNDWPWNLHDTYDMDGPVFPEFLHVVARVAHGLPPLEAEVV